MLVKVGGQEEIDVVYHVLDVVDLDPLLVIIGAEKNVHTPELSIE